MNRESTKRDALNSEEKDFLFEWLTENNKSLTRRNKELTIENLKLRSRVDELEQINFLDPTSGLHNRWYLQARLEEEFSRARRIRQPLSCLYLDIDFFKSLNDLHGHFIGDSVLRDMAGCLRQLCRREDVLVRFGGDAFVFLMTNAGQKSAMAAAERIRSFLHGHTFYLNKDGKKLTVCIGVSTMEIEQILASSDPWALIWTADGAFVTARQEGPGQIRFLPCKM